MNFEKHYFTEEQVDEKIGDVAKDITRAGLGGIAKATAKGAGRKALNVLKGITGRTKEIAFEPNWLKALKPINFETYKQTIRKYANWKNAKAKLGPKKRFEVKDIRDGVLGDFSGDDFEDILAKYDPSMKRVNMDAEIPPVITVYLLNNGGKVIFMQLPVGEDGKKKRFAMGLDSKAERAFRLIHGMTFQDYSLESAEEASKDDEEKSKKQQQKDSKIGVKYKFEIDKKDYEKLAPEKEKISNLAASNNSFSLFDIFNEEVIEEASQALKIDGKRALMTKKGEWYPAKKGGGQIKGAAPVKKFKKDDIAVNDKGEPSEDLQKELDKDIESYLDKKQKTDKSKKESDAYGKLYIDLKDELESPPNEVKPTEVVKSGWRYLLKNGGYIFVYKGKDGKYYIGHDEKAKDTVEKLDLIDKYGLEQI